MSAKEPSPPERTQSLFKELTATAALLNSASDELTEVVSCVDQALKPLNLGVSAWVEMTGGRDGNSGSYWSRDIGYSKVGKKWGIALRERSGNDFAEPGDEECEIWLFDDAPRWLRIESVGKIPDLLEHLIKQATSTTNRLRKKTEEAKVLVEAIQQIAGQKSSAAK
jgi:hypothetical protein